MNYKPRPGIVCAQLCGMNVLIPSRAANAHCTTILPLSLIGSIIWTGIEKDYPIEKVLEVYHIFSKKPDEELIEKIDEYCQKLADKGFAIPKDAPAGAGVPADPNSVPCSGAQCAPQTAPCSGAQCAPQTAPEEARP